jgi:hypothetical protein
MATPVIGDGSTDISGLPACVPPTPIDWRNVEGEPAATITKQTAQLAGTTESKTPGPEATVIETTLVTSPPDATPVTTMNIGWIVETGEDPEKQPWLDFPDLPAGTEAPADVQSAILTQVDAMIACLKPGVEDDLSGFFSEDFFRRSWVQAHPGGGAKSLVSSLFPNILAETHQFLVLEDGRVAVLADPPAPSVDDFAMFVIFTERDGQWVVDDSIRVGVGALMG